MTDDESTAGDEIPSWRLFLGAGPYVAVAGARALHTVAKLSERSIGSVQLVLGPGGPRSSRQLQSLLAACRRALAPGGRIALLARHPRTVLPDAVRGIRRRLTGESAAPRALDCWRRGTLAHALATTGFADIRTFACNPASSSPSRVEVAGQSSAARSAAWMLTATMPGTGSPFALEEMLRQVSAAIGASPERWSLESVTHSERGKSIALGRCADAGTVLRIARCEAMRQDEARSRALLEHLAEAPGIGRLVPRPLASGRVAGMDYYAQHRLPGRPLSEVLSVDNRRHYLEQAEGFLCSLNPRLETVTAQPISDTGGAFVGMPMIDFALRQLPSVEFRCRALDFVRRSLDGVVCRKGVVHGDFGTSNILVESGRLCGVIDWEASHVAGAPLLDAVNVLDAVHRQCRPGLSIVDTLPALASGNWPEAGELEFLRRMFDRCGADFRDLGAFVLLYLIFHVGPQLRYAARDPGPALRLEQALRRLMA